MKNHKLQCPENKQKGKDVKLQGGQVILPESINSDCIFIINPGAQLLKYNSLSHPITQSIW